MKDLNNITDVEARIVEKNLGLPYNDNLIWLKQNIVDIFKEDYLNIKCATVDIIKVNDWLRSLGYKTGNKTKIFDLEGNYLNDT